MNTHLNKKKLHLQPQLIFFNLIKTISKQMKAYNFLLIALAIYSTGCKNNKNITNKPNDDNLVTPIISLSNKDEASYLSTANTNRLLFNNEWHLISATTKKGNIQLYNDDKTYKFGYGYVSFNGDYPNDCNTCQVNSKMDTLKQILDIAKDAASSCTELKCAGMSSLIAPKDINDVNIEFPFNIKDRYEYKVSKNNILELENNTGNYKFRIAIDFKNKMITNLESTSWEIVAYQSPEIYKKDNFIYLKKLLYISFNANGYNYSPDCNTCFFNFDKFNTKNGLIKWTNQSEETETCTEKGCIEPEIELGQKIIFNPSTYEILNNYLIIKNKQYILKLRPSI